MSAQDCLSTEERMMWSYTKHGLADITVCSQSGFTEGVRFGKALRAAGQFRSGRGLSFSTKSIDYVLS
jgi:hypothetical protein